MVEWVEVLELDLVEEVVGVLEEAEDCQDIVKVG
jgi:hypothetical protein